MVDYISAELTATCAALGYYDGCKYHLDKHCIDVLKDLIKYLKRDDDSHTVRRFLGQTKLLQTDLTKILVEHTDKIELWDVLLRLIINLTSPAHVIYNEEIPTEKTMRNLYDQIVIQLQSYKTALTDDAVWTAISTRLAQILNIDSSERTENDELIIERILVFIRNVLQVPPNENEQGSDQFATVHDEMLFALHAAGTVDLLLFIATNKSEQQYHIQMLEIISLMLREQNPAQLASSGLQRSKIEKQRDEADLLAVREKEIQDKMEKIRKYAGSRFGGTYVVQNMKAIGDHQLICHKPFTKIEALEFGQDKKKVKRPKNKLPMAAGMDERTSALSVRLFLKEFCVEFLIGAYNPMMRYVKSCVTASDHTMAAESACYLWSLRFFMEFNRHYKFQVKYVSETISNEVFHFVQRQMQHYYEIMASDKKRIPLWSRRLHLALKAYQELLHTLMAMDKSTDHGVRESSKVIKSNVFYVPEYRETILSQLLCFDDRKMSRKYLSDLVTTAHIFMKMLEHFTGKGRKVIVTQKATKRRKGKKAKKPVPKELPPPPSLEERWHDLAPEVTAVMQDGVIPEVVPFDATLDTPVDDQKGDAMKRIQRLLRQRQIDQALGLIRAAREVWPENDCFGRSDIPPEEEFLALREIFFADLGVVEDQPAGTQEDSSQQQEADDDDEEDEEEEGRPAFEETDFKFSDFLQRLANVKIVKALAMLLRDFDKNGEEVNHYIVKMMHRIAWNCKMPGMIFQASIFRTFQKILESKSSEHKELQKFAIFIIRRFIETVQKNRKTYMELLFWKATRDAVEMCDGYTAEANNKNLPRGFWTEQEEDELRTLFMEHQTNKYPQDLIDWLLDRVTNETRTRRGIIKKLKEMCLFVNSKAVRSEVRKRLPKEWAEDEIAELTELWEQLKDDNDPVDLIFNGLRIKRPKPKIREQLLELGLAKDRKELRKKRARKSDQGKSSWETQSDGNSDGDQDSDEESAKSSGGSGMAPNKPTKARRTAASGSSKPRRKRKQPSVVYTDAQLSGLLKDVIDRGMVDAVEWLRESLQDALEDRDEESTEGIPLVPLTDYSEAAMDSPSFQKLLRAMNITPPADEQEAYWRIPADMLGSTMQNRCGLIADALAGKFVLEEPTPLQQRRGPGSDSDDGDGGDDDKNGTDDDDVDVLDNIKKYFAARSTDNFNKGSAVEPGESSSANGGSGSGNQVKAEASKKPRTSTTSEGPNERANSTTDADMLDDSQQSVDGSKKKSGGRLKMFLDSSDSEMEVERENENQEEPKRSRPETPDLEAPQNKKRRLLDSDDEDEPSPVVANKNSSTIIASDSEEEPEDNPRESADNLPEPENEPKSRAIVIDDEDEPALQTPKPKSRRIIDDDDDED